MLSKIAGATAFAVLVNSQGIQKQSAAYDATWGCAKCIINQKTFILPTANIRGVVSSNGSYAGKCCLSTSDSTNCASVLASTYTALAVSNTNSIEALLGQCEFNTAVCTATGGNHDSDTQNKIIDTIGDAEVQLKMSGSYAKDKDQCTWVVRVECGAPGILINTSTTVDASKMMLSYTDYSNEFARFSNVVLEGTDPHKVWMPPTVKPTYYDNSAKGGEPGLLSFKAGPATVWQRLVPGGQVHEWLDYVDQNYRRYEGQRNAYYKEVSKAKRKNLRHCFFEKLGWFCDEEKMVLPKAPDNEGLRAPYTGPAPSASNIYTGYGTFTSGMFNTIKVGSGRSYGTNGQDNQIIKGRRVTQDSNQQGIRLRKETGKTSGTGGCDDSYMMLSMIPLVDGPGELSIQISSQKWYQDFEQPKRPAKEVDYSKENNIKKGASALGFTISAFIGLTLY